MLIGALIGYAVVGILIVIVLVVLPVLIHDYKERRK